MYGRSNYGTYSVNHYNDLENRASFIEEQLDELRAMYDAIEDEDEAEDLFGDEIAELENELESLESEMQGIDEYWLTRDYYASVL